MQAFYAYVEQNRSEYVSRLREAVAIRGVSAWVDHRKEIVKMLEYAKRWGKKAGATDITLVPNPLAESSEEKELPPLLCMTFASKIPGAATVLAYGHLDVQPAKKEDGWATDPFELTELDGKLYGRGASDDKGPALSWLWVLEAWHELQLELPMNLKLLFEGCEEYGSLGLPEFIAAQSEAWLRDVDYVVVSDNTWVGTKTPCLTYGLRGMAYFELTVQGTSSDLHSGTHGAALRSEPLCDLIHLLGSLIEPDSTKPPHERIAVPGILDDVAPLTDTERLKYDKIDFDVDEYASLALGNGAPWTRDKAKHLMSRWRYPTLSLHGVEGAFSEPGAKTVIPGCVKGKFSMRLVPNMTPQAVEDKLRIHLEKEAAKLGTAHSVTLTSLHGGPPWLSDTDHPNYRAGAAAVLKVHGIQPDLTREGGSIPLATWLQDGLGVNVLLLPTGASDDGHHAQNEKYNVTNYINGIKLLGTYIFELAALVNNRPKPSECKCVTPLDLTKPGGFARGFMCKCEA